LGRGVDGIMEAFQDAVCVSGCSSCVVLRF
jgi:hypothetical protein